MPENGVITPDGATGCFKSSGLSGTIWAGTPETWIRLASLLYDAGTIWCIVCQQARDPLDILVEHTSIISSRGNCNLGMSRAPQAIK